jgi:hypothetical protein
VKNSPGLGTTPSRLAAAVTGIEAPTAMAKAARNSSPVSLGPASTARLYKIALANEVDESDLIGVVRDKIAYRQNGLKICLIVWRK